MPNSSFDWNSLFVKVVTFMMVLAFARFSGRLLGTAEPPEALPQTKAVTVTCPICGKAIAIPDYKTVTRSEALRRHIAQAHTSKVGRHPQALAIAGGEAVPPQYRELVRDYFLAER